MTKKNRVDRHHNIPKSEGWTNHPDNITYVDRKTHEQLHKLYWNKLPHEQIFNILDLSWQPFRREVKQELLKVLNADLEDIYLKHTIKPNFRN